MFETIFKGIFDNNATTVISVSDFLLCIGISLLIGLLLAFTYTYKNKTGYSKSFVVTLATLPAIVCVIIMMVNGNIGAGVAVAGAFSLVRFRSAPGSAKEIGAIFLAMGAGLITGMGYLAFAILFVIILSLINILYEQSRFGEQKEDPLEKTLRITIPENLNYTNVFDDLLLKYTDTHTLVNVKTSNMGSLFKLKYDLILKSNENEKEFIDALRCRNGNLEINISNQKTSHYEL